MLSLLSITRFIKYPDLLSAPVVITTTPAPVSLFSRSAGKIAMLKQDNQSCQQGEVVAYIQFNASMNAILDIEQKLTDNHLDIKTTGSLGDLQPDFSFLINAQTALIIFNETKAFDKQIEQLNQQLVKYKKFNKSLVGQQCLSVQESQLALKKFETDSLLLTQKVIATLDFNQAKSGCSNNKHQKILRQPY